MPAKAQVSDRDVSKVAHFDGLQAEVGKDAEEVLPPATGPIMAAKVRPAPQADYARDELDVIVRVLEKGVEIPPVEGVDGAAGQHHVLLRNKGSPRLFHRSWVTIAGRHERSRDIDLFPQPGGFEGVGLAGVGAPPDCLRVAYLRRLPEVLVEGSAATYPMRKSAELHDHQVSGVAYFPNLHTPVGEDAQEVLVPTPDGVAFCLDIARYRAWPSRGASPGAPR